jgi:hypothetical protein
MYVESALALTPAAIISDAKVCRHSCKVIGVSPSASGSFSLSFAVAFF